MNVEQRIGVRWIEVDPANMNRTEAARLIDLMMCYFPRDKFHTKLAEVGFYVTEGTRGVISDSGQKGIIFTIYKIVAGRRTHIRAGRLYTFMESYQPED